MDDVGLFIAGVLITIPAAAGIVGLIVAAIADGRENDRIQALLQSQGEPGDPGASLPTGGDR
jgi:hypothetical protein